MPDLYIIGIATGITLLCLLILAIVFIFKNSAKSVLVTEQQKQLESLAIKNKQLDDECSQLSAENIRLKTEYRNQQDFMAEKIRYVEKSREDLALKFRDISNEIIKNQSQQINESQKNALGNLLNPFCEQLSAFRAEINRANMENIKNKSSFDEQFKNLLSLNQSLSSDAQNLTEALRGSKKMQGDWGEIELNRILEVSGLQKNIDYFTQENFKNENNQNVRPDVVVRLPNKRSVIIDSKVSLNDYMAYVNATDDSLKEAALQRYIQCLKNHIDELSCKEYQKLLKEESLDYVVIFVPVESAFIEAIKKDDSLYDYAYKKNVALTTPSSLLPILRTVENLWRIENQNKYVQKIAEVGGSLYDKLANFVDDMQKIDKSLDTARQNYNLAISKLANGRGNALSLAERLKEYGAKANKSINIEFDDYENDTPKLNSNIAEKAS